MAQIVLTAPQKLSSQNEVHYHATRGGVLTAPQKLSSQNDPTA